MDTTPQQSAVGAFRLALDVAAPGDRITYHTGSLMFDRAISLSAKAAEVNGVANVVYDAYLAGKVILLQRKTGRIITTTENGIVPEFQYIAIRR